MDSRRRFQECMRYGAPDRAPLLEEPIREETVAWWRKQGLPAHLNPCDNSALDRHEVIEPDLEPRPELEVWPSSRAELRDFCRYMDPQDDGRLPDDWAAKMPEWRSSGRILMLRVQRGFFLSMGVDGWDRFTDVVRLLVDDPLFVSEMMELQGEFSARLAERILSSQEVDAAIFVEPIGGDHGPLISPRMYEEFVLKSYDRIMNVLRRHGIETIIFRTFANVRPLLPALLRHGFNCLWACEVRSGAMDYRVLRREFGRDLRLIGGIDLDVLRAGKEAIMREVCEKVPPLLADGGYAPVANGRIREDVPYASYAFYRELLQEVAGG